MAEKAGTAEIAGAIANKRAPWSRKDRRLTPQFGGQKLEDIGCLPEEHRIIADGIMLHNFASHRLLDLDLIPYFLCVTLFLLKAGRQSE